MDRRRYFSGISRTILETGETSNNNNYRLLRQADKYETKIAEIIYPKIEYENFKINGLKILEPEVMYKKKILEKRSKYIREEEIQCLGNDTIILELLGKCVIDKLKKSCNFCHLGLLTIAIKGLRRKCLGTKTLVHIYDDSWTNMGKTMIASSEIDMNDNIGIIYCMSDLMMSLKDLQQDIKIGIKTKGYEQQVKGSNLVINIGFIGRCTNYADNKVKIKVEDIVNLLTTKGARMVKPQAISAENLVGLEWNLGAFSKKTKTIIPKSSLVYQNTLGENSIRL